MADAVMAMQTPLTMGIGGRSIVAAASRFPRRGSDGDLGASRRRPRFYDVWSTFTFGLTLELPPPPR